jgi:hypothetical protein
VTTKTATLAPLFSALLAPLLPALAALSGCSGASTTTESATSATATGSTTAETSAGESSSSSTTDDGPPAPPGEVQVLTYNVAGLPQGISSSNPEDFMPLISPLLNDYELVLAQEDFYYHAQLAADVTHPYQTTPWMEPPDVLDLGDGLNRFSIYPMDLHERIGWGDCNGQLDCASDCLATKGWSFARTTLYDGAEGKVDVDVYNLHMEAGGCPEDIVIRQKSCENLAAEIMARSVSEGYPVIVAGDFNLRENDPEDVAPLDALMGGAGLTDACQHLDCGDIRIDKVLYRDGADVTLEAIHWEVPPQFVSPEGDDLSDHLPVAVRLAYTPR